ncbi:MAG: hypothetical protein HFG72_02365 [Hungatella sp.]|nr:hypothetical protein [Hungatella sp.]
MAFGTGYGEAVKAMSRQKGLLLSWLFVWNQRNGIWGRKHGNTRRREIL